MAVLPDIRRFQPPPFSPQPPACAVSSMQYAGERMERRARNPQSDLVFFLLSGHWTQEEEGAVRPVGWPSAYLAPRSEPLRPASSLQQAAPGTATTSVGFCFRFPSNFLVLSTTTIRIHIHHCHPHSHPPLPSGGILHWVPSSC
jgi:hypothetical protein